MKNFKAYKEEQELAEYIEKFNQCIGILMREFSEAGVAAPIPSAGSIPKEIGDRVKRGLYQIKDLMQNFHQQVLPTIQRAGVGKDLWGGARPSTRDVDADAAAMGGTMRKQMLRDPEGKPMMAPPVVREKPKDPMATHYTDYAKKKQKSWYDPRRWLGASVLNNLGSLFAEYCSEGVSDIEKIKQLMEQDWEQPPQFNEILNQLYKDIAQQMRQVAQDIWTFAINQRGAQLVPDAPTPDTEEGRLLARRQAAMQRHQARKQPIPGATGGAPTTYSAPAQPQQGVPRY
jgi:hypothetical protein